MPYLAHTPSSTSLHPLPPPTQTIFDESRGINIFEFEFPCYFNTFLKKRKTKFLTFKPVTERIGAALRESLQCVAFTIA